MLLARVVADPSALMASDYQDAVAMDYRVGTDDRAFPLTYTDFGNQFTVSALRTSWEGHTYPPQI